MAKKKVKHNSKKLLEIFLNVRILRSKRYTHNHTIERMKNDSDLMVNCVRMCGRFCTHMTLSCTEFKVILISSPIWPFALDKDCMKLLTIFTLHFAACLCSSLIASVYCACMFLLLLLLFFSSVVNLIIKM